MHWVFSRCVIWVPATHSLFLKCVKYVYQFYVIHHMIDLLNIRTIWTKLWIKVWFFVGYAPFSTHMSIAVICYVPLIFHTVCGNCVCDTYCILMFYMHWLQISILSVWSILVLDLNIVWFWISFTEKQSPLLWKPVPSLFLFFLLI